MHPHRVVLDVLSALCRLGRRPRHGECRGFVASLVFFFCNKREYKYKYEPLSRTRSASDMYRSSNRVHQLRHLQPSIKMWHWTCVFLVSSSHGSFVDASDQLISCKEAFHRPSDVFLTWWKRLRGSGHIRVFKIHFWVLNGKSSISVECLKTHLKTLFKTVQM